MPTTMRHMERDTRFELALLAWKASVLAANTSPALVRAVGLEPTRSHDQRILSPLRLPIPPRPHILHKALLK